MKRLLSLLLSLLLLFLAGCSNKDNITCLPADLPVPTDLSALRCRVVSEDADSGTFLLAGMDTEHPEIYTLDAVAALTAGDMVEIAYTGGIQETYPARFGSIESVTVLPDEFDDLCALYLRVLRDLWEKDEGLNDSVEMISVDLSATSLSPAERSAVVWRFAQLHDISLPLELNYKQLCEEGYISGLTQEDQLPAWENGMLFTITEASADGSASRSGAGKAVSFDADKWRTALGAYGFSSCVAAQDSDGKWGDYRITGGEWIS